MFRTSLFIGAALVFLSLSMSCTVSLQHGFDPHANASRDVLVPEWKWDLYEPEPLSLNPQERSAIQLHGELVILGGADGVVRVLNANTGRLNWRAKTGERVEALAIVLDGHLLIGSYDGYLYCFSLEDGTVEWRYNTGAPILSEVASSGGRVFVVNNRNSLFALDVKTGKYLWSKKRTHRSEFTIDGQAGILVHEGMVYLGYSDGHLIAMEPEDGATVWSTDLGGQAERFADVDTTPVFRNGILYAASFRGGFYALEPGKGEIVWRHAVEGASAPVFEGDRLFISTSSGEVRCLNAVDGAVIWRTQFGDVALSQPGVVGPFVLVATGRSLTLLRASNGYVVNTWSESDGFLAVPAVASGMVYALSNQGTLYGLNWYTDGLD